MSGTKPIIWSTSQTIYRLPRSHWHCHFNNFQWGDVQPQALRRGIEQFLTTATSRQPTHLILSGAPGVGKTHLSVASYRWMINHVGTIQATWLNVPALCDQVKAAFNDPDANPLEEYAEARALVVLDDLFGRQLTDYESRQILPRLLDTAYQNGAAILATMNQEIQELHTLIAHHEVSRLLAHAIVIPMVGKDWRRE